LSTSLGVEDPRVEEDEEGEVVPVRFGWVLEGRLGGMAFPTPAHLRYLERRQRVGLVVTLTPEPLPTSCRPIDTNHGGSRGVRPLQFLHLPIAGLIIIFIYFYFAIIFYSLTFVNNADYESPTEEQIVAFMKEARATIKSGYGVVAHCHKVRPSPPPLRLASAPNGST
jgi:hypothetical protein